MSADGIEFLYTEIRKKILDLKISEAKEYFDNENIPKSLNDKSFCIGLINMDPGDFEDPDSEALPLKNFKSLIKIFLFYNIPANDRITKMIEATQTIAKIIYNILQITVGSNQIDRILYVGSSDSIENSRMVAEINFECNLRYPNVT